MGRDNLGLQEPGYRRALQGRTGSRYKEGEEAGEHAHDSKENEKKVEKGEGSPRKKRKIGQSSRRSKPTGEGGFEGPADERGTDPYGEYDASLTHTKRTCYPRER